MSAFNTVAAPLVDEDRLKEVTVKVQFKYGECRQYEYSIGDALRWGGNDVGLQGMHHVVVDGCLDGSIAYNGIPEDYEVHIVDNVIARVVPSSGKYDFVHAKEAYIVLG